MPFTGRVRVSLSPVSWLARNPRRRSRSSVARLAATPRDLLKPDWALAASKVLSTPIEMMARIRALASTSRTPMPASSSRTRDRMCLTTATASLSAWPEGTLRIRPRYQPLAAVVWHPPPAGVQVRTVPVLDRVIENARPFLLSTVTL